MSTQPGDGQILDQHPQPTTQPIAVEASILICLIEAATTSDTSPWVNIQSFSKFALEVNTSASSDFSVQLNGSLSLQNPALDSATAYALGSPVTSVGITFPSLAAVRWVQAVLTNTSTEAVTVNLTGIAP